MPTIADLETKRIAKDCLSENNHVIEVFLDAAENISHVSVAAFRDYAQGKQGDRWDIEQAVHIEQLRNPRLVEQQDPIRTFDRQRLENNAAKVEVKEAIEAALAKAREGGEGYAAWALYDEFRLRAFQIHCDCVKKR